MISKLLVINDWLTGCGAEVVSAGRGQDQSVDLWRLYFSSFLSPVWALMISKSMNKKLI